MDLSALVPQLVTLLIPFLPYLVKGDEVAEEAESKFGAAAWERAKTLWGKLHPKVAAKAAAQEAVQDAAAAPDNEDAKAALRVQLKKLLADDPGLAEEIARQLSGAQAAGVVVTASGPRSVAVGGSIKGSTITTGDQNTVNQQRSTFVSESKYDFSSASFSGSILNIESNLTGAIQTIGAATNLEPSVQKQLQQLLEQLQAELKQVPPAQAAEAEAVAATAKLAVEEATKEKPNKTMVQITGDGLKKAAENVGAVMPKVLEIAGLIVAAIGKFVV
jgi:hypothetical protein